jgi:hypothetical protein
MEQRRFTYGEAIAVLPEARQRIALLAEQVAELERLGREVARQEPHPGVIAEGKALEARVDHDLDWFRARGVQIKGISPALLDFPASARLEGADVEVLLCWRDGEDTIAWYHPAGTGFAARAPVAHLDEV